MYRRIMVPVDGSAFSETALPVATALASALDATLDLVEVAADPRPGAWPGDPTAWDSSYLETLEIGVREAGAPSVARHLLEGPVEARLAQHAVQSGADLVVLATHGRGPLARAWLGSVADGLLRRAHVPLLLVRPDPDAAATPRPPEDPLFGNVLVPLDGSPEAERVLESVLDLAGPLGADLTLLRVVEQPFLPSMAFVPERLRDTGELLREEVAAAGRYLAGVARRLETRGVRVWTTVALSERPAASILEHARGHPIELVAMATHGRQGLERAVLGSVTEKVVRGARKPVLVLPPAAAAAMA